MNQCEYIDKIMKLEKELKEYRDTGIEPLEINLIQEEVEFLRIQNKTLEETIALCEKIIKNIRKSKGATK